MRLRNIPRADSVLEASPLVISSLQKVCGAWNSQVFREDHPIHIEIGMGKGQFLLSLATQNPHINYIGIERYSSVLLRAVEKLGDLLPENLRFLCTDARTLPDIFQKGEVSAIYLNFSDPWPKARHAKRRLTSSFFLPLYHQILKTDGRLEFKTDNRLLFDFSLEEIQASPVFELVSSTYDLHRDPVLSRGNIMTEYEEKFSSKGNAICKLIARPKENCNA
ncbi:tRNA (guanosine(46)-N7)-methyltransferase TrmB [Suipraeoptans intestinalis]|uniref:tRNA (guanosine(46)-N7)-methyltransferase TrmB n=1 Tax=Suipraeoptans intestinalis TaxID=2606628 RepID=UPI002A764C82|nr:tRNA (guanosine(46)-N7)-methyltransferase TrmB [Suipraeoptans intestinalis]MDY3121139.1 tRNA (guanosine(46)-N7)-methyltransferase TrmB [Suipraeoptans intestinalis]